MQKKYVQLKTSLLVNIIKLAISIPACLIAAVIGLMKWGGVEYVISVFLICIIFYFHRLRYEQEFATSIGPVIVKVDSNFLGHKFIKIIHEQLGINEVYTTRENTFSYSNKKNDFMVDIIFSPKDDPRPIASVN
ncbi:hypothetical protein HWQ46_24220 [Shewanella sp. D64]|uniref:hypothetical protein n=1 Tax=unclassified Shewanella TaxID=196818 RepID=UPI0022BA579E|nr:MULTISPECIES: hypothetical protein [unclassified Shewanella]MEC4728632.1 hypothetical protein [Shewanella sp. D64]MEC4737881.1 hypothetical protein [Shewanella sp. E94]WBJ93866.1 hypothetical protein HWQ47_18295 [Shewanella sp. MTB7]